MSTHQILFCVKLGKMSTHQNLFCVRLGTHFDTSTFICVRLGKNVDTSKLFCVRLGKNVDINTINYHDTTYWVPQKKNRTRITPSFYTRMKIYSHLISTQKHQDKYQHP